MKRHCLATVFLAAVATMAAFTSADLLKVGDPAPALTVGKWVKGEPIKEFEKGKIYVVEFWATWCGPCKATIPHLSEMAKANPDVTFIGANVWERDETLVEPFVKEMGDKMSYSVVMDDKSKDEKGAMATTWMEAAGRNGIPAAFLVNKEGVVAWIGHPMQLDEVLKDVVAGEYNLDDAKAAADVEAKQRENEMALSKEFEEKVMPALDKQDWDAAVKALDEMAAAHPESKEAITGAKFNILIQAGKFDLAYVAADQIAEINDKNAEKLNELAWFIVDNQVVATRDLDRAARYAARAVELTDSKNGAVLDTLARVHFEKGEVEKAVELQTKALEVASDGERDELAKSLEKYKAALPK